MQPCGRDACYYRSRSHPLLTGSEAQQDPSCADHVIRFPLIPRAQALASNYAKLAEEAEELRNTNAALSILAQCTRIDQQPRWIATIEVADDDEDATFRMVRSSAASRSSSAAAGPGAAVGDDMAEFDREQHEKNKSRGPVPMYQRVWDLNRKKRAREAATAAAATPAMDSSGVGDACGTGAGAGAAASSSSAPSPAKASPLSSPPRPSKPALVLPKNAPSDAVELARLRSQNGDLEAKLSQAMFTQEVLFGQVRAILLD